jgi:glycerol kinase
MQFQADILGQTVLRPKVRETTALGAAYLAGLAVGFWRDRDELSAMWQVGTEFKPSIDEAKREELLAGWHNAVAMTRYQA